MWRDVWPGTGSAAAARRWLSCTTPYDPARVLISAGDDPLPGVYSIAADDPDPRSVSVASGKVLYTLARSTTGPYASLPGIAGRLLVQMIDDAHIREEMFVDQPAADFTPASRIFSR